MLYIIKAQQVEHAGTWPNFNGYVTYAIDQKQGNAIQTLT